MAVDPMIETTGYRQKEAWARREMPPLEQIRDGLWSIPVPMPGNPLRYVLVYALALADGLAVIDAGWNCEKSWDALVSGINATGHAVSDVRYIAVTHLHPDHFGLAPRLRKASGAALAMHRNDAVAIRHHDAAHAAEHALLSDKQLADLGTPQSVRDAGIPDLERFGSGETADILLVDGQSIDLGGWDLQVVWTPGHTPGHVCFLDVQHGLFFSGDHVLPRISPNISSLPGQNTNPLDLYIKSLQSTADLPEVEVLPAHEFRFRGLPRRARSLLAHHETRLNEIADVVAGHPELSSWEISNRISWSRPLDRMPVDMLMMAVLETHSHLQILEGRRLVIDASGSNPARWTLNTGHPATETYRKERSQ
jgi:glyoxylase-like metal-dependent hydrolase (beta-lactamase superfamily II)